MIFLLAWAAGVSAGALEEYTQAKAVFQAAGACTAAYSSRFGSLAVGAFEREGWRVEPYSQSNDKAEVRFILAWDARSASDQDRYLLAVSGTENIRDVKVDLRAKKVYFAGATLEEFAANAQRTDLPPDVPRVHEGFNQVAELLLSMQSAQSNDALKGTPRLLTSILREDPNDKVYLVGHSMGGAVVTLVAARLMSMGVRPEQIEVLSFGAPSVGNKQFVQQNEGKFPLTRIVVADDPVPQALRRVYGGYRHLGREVVWPVPEVLKTYTPHDMPVYLDIAIRNFYRARAKAMKEGVLPTPEPIPGKPRLYVAPVKNGLPQALQGEWTLMNEVLMDEYKNLSPGVILDGGASGDDVPLLKAAEAECDFLVLPEIQATKIQNETNYYVSLRHTVYRVRDGTVVSVGDYSSNTRVLTPMEALYNGALKMNEDSAAWLESK